MRLVEDFTHQTPHDGRCRVRIYTDDELPVVICTEARDNPGQSVTNAAEQIAAEVITNHPEIFDPFIVSPLPGVTYDKPFVWVEHYTDGARGTPEDRATFDLVEFGHYEPREVLRAGQWTWEIGTPSWSPLDRQSVETLTGERVD
jgi:hypothetical protein